MAYTILEVANSHGGSVDYLKSLIDEFADLDNDFGIKFQVFRFDLISHKLYKHYELYKNLFIEKEEWKNIIDYASLSKDVWLDIFDLFGVDILKSNIDKIMGIKLQSSILYNYAVLSKLSEICFSKKLIVINVSGLSIEDVISKVEELETLFPDNELLIEIGFQDYPTKLKDSGLVKIKPIKNVLKNRLVYADHSSPKSDESIFLPIIAIFQGVEIIEKHIMHSTKETRFDYHSASTPNDLGVYLTKVKKFIESIDQPFINNSESNYLSTTIQIPILKKDLDKGSLVSFDAVSFLRSDKEGISFKQIDSIQRSYSVLSCDKKIDETLDLRDFKKANIAAIIVARMKSTRLPKKATVSIGELSSIEHCIKNTMLIQGLSQVVLATSNLSDDDQLESNKYMKEITFYRGHPENVLDRLVSAVNEFNIDIVIRVTGDCPFVSNDIAKFLLKEHFRSGADFTASNEFAVGTSVEIINSSSLRFLLNKFPEGHSSEYLSSYFHNNDKIFNVNIVNLPEEWVRPYRLTLDHEEDLVLLRKIEDYLSQHDLNHSIDNIFSYLDSNPDVALINMHLRLKYKFDKVLMNKIKNDTTIVPN